MKEYLTELPESMDSIFGDMIWLLVPEEICDSEGISMQDLFWRSVRYSVVVSVERPVWNVVRDLLTISISATK